MNDTKKKLLFITRRYPPSVGGMENALYQIAKGLPDDNLSVDVLALGRKNINLIWFFPYALLYTLLNAWKYDYLMLGDAVMCMCGGIAKIVHSRIKRFTILHGLDVTFKNPIYQLYLKLNLKRGAECFICNSSYTRGIAVNWGLPDSKVEYVALGVEIDRYKGKNVVSREEFLKKYSISNKSLVLVTTGRMVKRKGVEWFIRKVLPKLGDVVYLVIGTGEEKANIEAAISEADEMTQKKVRLAGRVSDEELTNCLMNSDVFVMPNFHVKNNAEGFGLVALEASLAGLLVLASRVDGIPDAIQDKKNGFLLEPLDDNGYVQMIDSITGELEKYKEIAEEFRKFTAMNYSWDNTCDSIKKIIRKY